MAQKVFAYIRVSSKDQNTARQYEELKTLVADERDIYTDKASGKDFNRDSYKALKRQLREGDLLYVMSIDRLGRNYDEILDEWKDITKNIKAHVRVLDMPLLDTTRSGADDLTGTLIADIVLQVLSYVAQKERENIRQRQAQGIKAAKEKGVALGRPKIQCPANWDEVYSDWVSGKITAVKAMEMLGLKKRTFYNMAKACQG